MILRKDEIEASLLEENKLIQDGKLKEDNPLDSSEIFNRLCEACRRGDLKICQEMITEGANLNARDRFDYTPLILVGQASPSVARSLLTYQAKASLCGHFEVVQLLLESGALCERDTFQGERCLYNALNDRIRNLLLSYDYSKSSDPLQPFASHITSLLAGGRLDTSDILVTGAGETFRLHKFVLSARSPYFSKKLSNAPDTTSWKLPPAIAPQAFGIAIRYLYLGEVPNEVEGGPGTGFSEDEVLDGIEKVSRQLEVRSLWDGILEGGDRRLARQRRTEEVERGRTQLDVWFTENVVKHKVVIDSSKARELRWDRNNGIFADVLLRADEPEAAPLDDTHIDEEPHKVYDSSGGIPVGPVPQSSRSSSRSCRSQTSVLFPAHRAMLIRSEFFMTMFSSAFLEAQSTDHLQIIPIDCPPEVLEIVLKFLYTEKTDFPLELAIDVLFAADLLFIEKLKLKAAVVISTLGNGSMSQIPARLTTSADVDAQHEVLDIYDVIRAGWLTRVPRLEEFGARFLAYRLESYIDEEEFADLVRESAQRIKGRQATDTIELLDDIRYYLSERFRLRFEDSGIEELMEEEPEPPNLSVNPDTDNKVPEDEGIEIALPQNEVAKFENPVSQGTIRTLDGEIAGDELEGDAINYQILLGKIDGLLDKLRLDA